MNVLKAIGHFFKHAAVFVKDELVKAFGSETAHVLAVAAMSILNTELGKIAESVVTELQAVEIPATEKRSAALSKIADAAKAAGIEAGTSLINVAIEMAVQKIKGNIGESSTVQPAL